MLKDTIELELEGIELTDALVLTRTRAPDLESVKKLNCWASQIKDVQVVRRMPNLEVCSLSINKITSLRDFAHCHKLKELYVRTNNIQQLGDIHYLRGLPRLRSLWLSENPCANAANYRSTVLRSLPNLQKLDNKIVSEEEVERAKLEGDDIPIPENFSESSIYTVTSLDDTQSSIASSIDCRAPVRSKREQRRQRLAYRNSQSVSQDEEGSGCSNSFSGKSEEEQSSEKSDSDTGWHAKKPCAVSESFESISDVTESVIAVDSSFVSEHDNKDHFDDDHDIDESNRNSNKLLEGKDLQRNNSNNVDSDQPQNNKADDDNNNNNDTGNKKMEGGEFVIDDVPKNFISQSEQQTKFSSSSSKKTNIGDSDSLLDKIRLDDSLNCDASQDVEESITLDDLVIEVGEALHKKAEIEVDDIIEISVNSSVSSELPSKEVSTSDTIKNAIELTTENELMEKIAVKSSERGAGAPNIKKTGELTDGKKNGLVVDWDEHNRLRAELGVKQVERMSVKSSHNDVNRIRNSNILQAVLSLIKELDKDSLDIVSATVKCRLDKL